MNIIYTKCFDTQIQQNNDVQMQKNNNLQNSRVFMPGTPTPPLKVNILMKNELGPFSRYEYEHTTAYSAYNIFIMTLEP